MQLVVSELVQDSSTNRLPFVSLNQESRGTSNPHKLFFGDVSGIHSLTWRKTVEK